MKLWWRNRTCWSILGGQRFRFYGYHLRGTMSRQRPLQASCPPLVVRSVGSNAPQQRSNFGRHYRPVVVRRVGYIILGAQSSQRSIEDNLSSLTNCIKSICCQCNNLRHVNSPNHKLMWSSTGPCKIGWYRTLNSQWKNKKDLRKNIKFLSRTWLCQMLERIGT